MLDWFRTMYGNNASRVFHVVPFTSAAYSDLCKKYGSNSVIRGNGATDGVALTAAISRCVSGRNDRIILHAGTFVAGAVVVVDKVGVTIEGASENANATLWDCDTTDCAAFSITAAGVTLKNFSLDEPAAGTTDLVTSTGAGTILENLVVRGGNIASAVGTINVTGDYTTVRGCRLHLVRKGIVCGGNYSHVLSNFVGGSDGTAGNFGITITGAAARLGQLVKGNTVLMSGAANPKALVVAANADVAAVIGNALFSAGDALEVQADTYGVANLDLSLTVTATTGWLAE